MFIFESRFHAYIPFLVVTVLFLASWYAMKQKYLPKRLFNLVWNSLQLFILIGMGFSAFVMMYRSDLPVIKDATFDFSFWHVQFGVVFITMLFYHFLSRWMFYLQQAKYLTKSPKKKN